MAQAAAWLALTSVLACAGCGGSSLRNGVYADDQARYRIGALPARFERVDLDDNDLAFHHRGEGTISVNATCSEYEDVPLPALVNHLLFETTDRRFVTEETVTVDGRAARHVVVQAQLDGVAIELDLYVLKKDGCVIDFAHIRTPNAAPAARELFRSFVTSFALLEAHGDV